MLFHLVMIACVGGQQRAGAVVTVRAMAEAALAGSGGSGCAALGLSRGTSGPQGVSGSLAYLPEAVSGFVRLRAAGMSDDEESGFEKADGTSFAWALRSGPDAVHYAVDAGRVHAADLWTSVLISVLVAAANLFWAPATALGVVLHQRAIARSGARAMGDGATAWEGSPQGTASTQFSSATAMPPAPYSDGSAQPLLERGLDTCHSPLRT